MFPGLVLICNFLFFYFFFKESDSWVREALWEIVTYIVNNALFVSELLYAAFFLTNTVFRSTPPNLLVANSQCHYDSKNVAGSCLIL